MASVDLLAGAVMDGAASLMNDTARTVYTYTAQLPYINIALAELREEYERHALGVTQNVSAVIQMDAGDDVIVFNGLGVPALPSDMVEPQQLWERNRNIDPYIPMTKREYLPHNLEGIEINQFVYWVWQSNEIRVLPSNQNNDIKIDYVKQLFQPVTNEFSILNVINAETFLKYRTAGLLAEFIERNLTSANAMNAYAMLRMDTALGIGSKGKQRIVTRRQPFRANYKRGGWVT